MTSGLSARLVIASAAGVALVLYASSARLLASSCERPWVFFDLGNTVVASAPGKESRYVPGAHAYVRSLRERGVRVGLITNVPEKWGKTRREKIRELKKVIGETWTNDATAERMDWSDFPDSAILIPSRDADRKPASYLFHAALADVSLEEGRNDCPVYYLGEDPAEVAAAEKAGMKGYVVLRDGEPPFLPYERMEHP